MAGIRIEIDEATGEVSIGAVPRRTRDHKGQSLLEFPEKYVTIDIETTGLDPEYDDIIELGSIRYEHGQAVGEYQSLVNPGYTLGDWVAELTGITNEMLASAPSIDVVLPKFLNFVGSDIVVGHNVNFDINFIYDNAEKLGLAPFANDFVDTMRISRRLYKDLKHHKLSTLKSHFNIDVEGSHRAIADCMTTHILLEMMRVYADEIGGIPQNKKSDFYQMSKQITAETEDFDIDSPIYGMGFTFTGKLERMSRREAMQAVVNAGGICYDTVVKDTNYLVIGNLDYCKSIKGDKSSKQKKAEKMQLAGSDIATISEDVFYDMLEQ